MTKTEQTLETNGYRLIKRVHLIWTLIASVGTPLLFGLIFILKLEARVTTLEVNDATHCKVESELKTMDNVLLEGRTYNLENIQELQYNLKNYMEQHGTKYIETVKKNK